MAYEDHIALRGGFYYSNELWYSKAYQDLSKSARELLHCFVNELRFSYFGKGVDKKKEYINHSKLSFTEIQFKVRYGFCSATYIKARNQLIKCGFVKQTYRGGYARGDMATYKLLIVPEVKLDNQRWRKYPEKNWESDIPKPKKQLVGVATQFKKGKSGRKTKATLKK